MTTVPEEAVKAMPERIYASAPSSSSGCVVSFDVPSLAYDVEYVRADLVAPFLQGVKVKALEWHDRLKTSEREGFVCSEGGVLSYSIMLSKFRVYGIPGPHDGAQEYDTLEAAKAAAQADYSARILSALEPTAARELALEEIIALCRDYGEDSQPDSEYRLACNDISEAIQERRSLSSPDHADAGKVEGDGGAAARDVLAERRRQIEAEGWTPEHDNQFVDRELAKAAACYAIDNAAMWPWSMSWWKPRNSRRNLVKAGALILAEIERLDRLPSAPSQEVAGS